MKNWNELSIKDKNDIIRVAVQNGITALPDIRERYNEFAEGGDITDEEYAAVMEKVAENNNPIWNRYRQEEGLRPLSVDEEYLRILNDNSYNYRGYYSKYPNSMVNADTHWPDEFKTVYHPTFSNESVYSGVKSQYNPEGLVGGSWQGETFIPAPWQRNNEYSSGGKIHIKPENRGKFTALKKRTGHSASWFKAYGTPAQRKMATFALNARKWKHGDGGNLLWNGGTQSSDNTRVDLGIVTNLPLDDSAESKFYRDLALLGAETEEEKKAQELRDRATNQGAYQHTVAPTDIEARTGWMEVNPLTGDVTPYAATTVSAAPLTEGQRMWRSPAFQLALAPMFDAPFMLGKAANAANKSIEQLIYRNKLSGIEPFGSFRYPGDAYSITEGVSPAVKSRLMKNVVGRNVRELESEGFRPNAIRNYTNNLSDALDEVRVGRFSGKDFVKAGEGDNAGFYIDGNNFMAINRDAANFTDEYVQSHEARHLMDYRQSLTNNQQRILSDAYGDDFVNLPATRQAEGLEGYTSMAKEKVTTNHDARAALLGNKQDMFDIHTQDLVIDKTPDAKIFDAVEKANGYGRRYIKYLRENNLLTPEKAQAFREAMKHVGGYVPWTIGGGAAGYGYLNQDEGPIVAFANGGHLYDGESEDTQQMYTGFDWWNREPLTDYMDIAYEPIPDNAPKSKRTPLLDTPIMVQTTPTVSSAATFGQYMPKYESTPKRELITLGATVAAPFIPSVGKLGLQAMNTAFTPSTWLNPVTGAKLLSPTIGTIADAGVQGAFAYEGLNGLWNQGKQGTLLSNPANTIMHGLEVLPLVGLGTKAVGMGVDAWNRSGMKALWDISRNDAPVNIESSFVPKTIEYVKREPKARLDFLERNPSRISEAERAGIPKGDRNSKTIDRPNKWFPEITENNAHRVSDAQWDAAYNKAIADNNTDEVQRLRDLHFYAKTGETPTIMYRGSVNPTLRNTYYRDDGSAVWLTPDYNGAAYYRPHGTQRPPRAHYVKTRDNKVLHINGGGNMWSNIPPENVPEEVLKHLGDPHKSNGLLKLFPIGYETGDIVHGAKLAGYKQVDFQNIIDAKLGENFMSKTGKYPQFTTRYYNNIKLADPITYDDAGNIIPLSKRDDFNNSDIRYGWLPWILGVGAGTAGYSHLNQDQGPLVEYAVGGRLSGK